MVLLMPNRYDDDDADERYDDEEDTRHKNYREREARKDFLEATHCRVSIGCP
jgi:hypothetical protein